MIKEEFWNRDLIFFEIPKFQCPICHKGLLITDKENLKRETTKESERYYDVVGEPECYKGQFVSISRCNNPDCQEIITIAGETEVIEHGWDDGRDPDTFEELFPPHPKYKTVYRVKYTNPSISLIKFPNDTPKELVEIIEASFQLFGLTEHLAAIKLEVELKSFLTCKG